MTGRALTLSLLACATLAGGAAAQSTPRIHLPEAEDVGIMLRDADAARARGDLERAIDFYRLALDGDGRGYQVVAASAAPRDGAQSSRRWVGVTERAIAGLRALPPEGVKLFRARYDRRAEHAMNEARGAQEPLLALARVYDLYPVSTHAPTMLQLMAGLALERGQLDRARLALRRLLADHAAEVRDPSGVRRQLLVCAVSLGRVEDVRALVRDLKRDAPTARVWPGSKPLDEQELVTRAMQARSERGRPSLRHGRVDPTQRASVQGKATIGGPRFSPRVYDPERPSPARSLPLLHEDKVIVVTADQVLAFDVRTGAPAPRLPRLGPAHRDTSTKVQTGGAIEGGMLVVPFVDEVRRDEQFRGVPIKVEVPIRKLAGLDLAAWRWTWNHARLLDGTRLERTSFPAPPTAVEGVVYAPAFNLEGFVNASVAAFDAVTGAPLWDTWVASGQLEQTMFGEVAIEPLCTPVAVDEGVVYHATSLGCVAALDAATGRPRWISAHEHIDVRAPAGFFPDPRPLPWENNAPLVVADTVIAAPLDSNLLVAFDARTGERRWDHRSPGSGSQRELRWVIGAGVRGDQAVVVAASLNELRAFDARNGRLLWPPVRLEARVAGRGCLAHDAVSGQLVAVVPLESNRVVFYDALRGTSAGPASIVVATGNVVLVGEHALLSGPGTLAVHRAGEGPE